MHYMIIGLLVTKLVTDLIFWAVKPLLDNLKMLVLEFELFYVFFLN